MQLTGFGQWHDAYGPDRVCLMTAAGPSLAELDFNRLALDSHRCVVVSVAGSIRYWHEKKHAPDWWVVTDEPIIHEYWQFVPPSTCVAALQQAVRALATMSPKPPHRIWTGETMDDPKEYGNDYQFYSRGTCLIAAMLVARYMGIRLVYVVGFDCYRTDRIYHYDGRIHPDRREQVCMPKQEVKPGTKRYITEKLNRMIVKSRKAAEAGLFDDMDVTVVNELSAQRAFKRQISFAEFYNEWDSLVEGR